MSARYFCNRCLEEPTVATRWLVLVVPSVFRYHELFQPLVIADAALQYAVVAFRVLWSTRLPWIGRWETVVSRACREPIDETDGRVGQGMR